MSYEKLRRLVLIVRCLLLPAVIMLLLPVGLAAPENSRSERRIRDIAHYLEQKLEDTLTVRDPFRADGLMYAIDLANIMRATALTDNRRSFDVAFHLLMEHFLLTHTDDPNARYTVLWRWKEGRRRDASGSAETIAAADGLWGAYKQWGEEQFRLLALEVTKAYLRHGYWIDERRFCVKNYYNYQTRSFAENTWLLNHAPDVLLNIGEGSNDSALVRHAYGMAAFMKGAYVKEGFSKEMFDAGIRTVFKKSSGYYAPDGMYSFFSSTLTAQALLPFDTSAASQLIRFAASTLPHLWSKYYYDPVSQRFSPFDSISCGLTERMVLLDLASNVEAVDTTMRQRKLNILNQGVLPVLSRGSWGRFNQFYFQVPMLIRALYGVMGVMETSNGTDTVPKRDFEPFRR